MRTVARVLQLGRSRVGLTQQELAKRADIHVNTVIFAESGQQRPRPRTLAKIARVLGLDLEELLDLADRDGRQSA